MTSMNIRFDTVIIQLMQGRRGNHRSTERVLEEHHVHPRVSYERKCLTPSVFHQQKKSKSKHKERSNEKRSHHNNSRHLKQEVIQLPQPKHQEPFKHKNRPNSTLQHHRHAQQLQHNLSNLHDSSLPESLLYQSTPHHADHNSKPIAQAKRLMKNNQFQRALSVLVESKTQISQGRYLMGVCAFHLQHWAEAAGCFGPLLEDEPRFKKNAYLFLGIALKKLGRWEDALATLGNTLQLYPKYYDALVLRAKILTKQHRYYDALQDLDRSLALSPNSPQSLVTKADTLRALQHHDQAIELYTQLLTQTPNDQEVILKRAIALIESGKPEQAMKDLNSLIQKSPQHSEAYLFKGVAWSKMKNYNEAILAYEQAIKFNTSRKATTKALYQVSKLKIQVGDYYGASYTLERGATLDVETRVIEKLRVFTEGATAIMKKKYRRGIENMTYLAKKEHLNQQIRPLVLAFRSYAHFCQCRFGTALADLKAMQSQGYKLDPASQYNQLLLQGIAHAQNNSFSQAIALFTAAEQARHELSDPVIYKCLAKLGQYNRNPKTKDTPLLHQAFQHVQHALTKEDNNTWHYLASAILYTLRQYPSALNHLQQAIQLADDHVPKHFYLRGLIHAITGNTQQAYVDFTNVLSLGREARQKWQAEGETDDVREGGKDKEILEAYLNRAKCHLLFGDKKKAFQDLQTYISFKPLDSEIHTVAGRLLFSIGACEDAIKAYNYSPNIDKKRDELLERAKCYLLLKELNLTLRDLEKAIEMGDSPARLDYCALAALKEASKNGPQNYRQALRKLVPIESLQVTKGHIFTQGDVCFYRGVFQFYLGQYPEAQKCFQKSKTIKQENEELEHLALNDPAQFTPQIFDNRTYSDAQIDYNIALCQLMQGKTDQATKILGEYESFKVLLEGKEPSQPLDLTPFPTPNRLCSIFPQTEWPQKSNIRFRISFCLPAVHPPDISFDIQPRIIQEIGMHSVQPRPDAPWIKRNHFGVVFTDEVVGVDIDIKTEKSLKKLQQMRIEAQPQQSPPPVKQRLKEMFALDPSVEDKLNQFMRKH